MAAIFGKWNICWNLERLVFTDTLWVKNFAEIPLVNFYYSYISIVLYVYLMTLYFQFCVLHFVSKILKFNMTPIFGEEKFFFAKLVRVVV